MAEHKVEDLLGQLSLEEKVGMLAGIDMWRTRGIPRLGVPGFKVTDGPNGARGGSFDGPTAACVPCGSALAATWNTDLVARVGAVLGEEARSKCAQVLLAPTVNIHRSPLAGRNFECYSEDPYLSARMAIAFINGVQSTGVGACIKHFVANDSEFERHSISSQVGERALREIYLAPFEAAVKEAEPWSLMSAYNKVRLHSALSFLRPMDYYRGNPEALLAERRRKLSTARVLRKQENIKLRQRLLPWPEVKTVSCPKQQTVSL